MFVPKPLIAGDDLVSQALWSFDSSRLGDDGFVAWLGHHWNVMVDWLSQPLIIAWFATFTIIWVFITVGLGFGHIGVGAGTLAAAFQSWMYGGFTPAGGIFASLTSMAMLGTLQPMAAVVASLLSTVVAIIVWKCGVGRA